MRAAAVGICTLVLLGASARAEVGKVEALHELQHTTAEQRAAVQTEFMKARLELTASQLSRVETLNLEFARKADPVLKGSSSLFEKGREIRALDAAKKEQLRGILTPEQLARYSKLQPELEQTLLDQLKGAAGEADGG